MEDFLPILIGIIWVAITLYNKGKKKSKGTTQQPLAKKESRAPSLLEQILMGEVPVQPQPSVATNYTETNYREISEPDTFEMEEKRPSPFLNEELSQFIFEGQQGIVFDEMDLTVREQIHESVIKETDFDLKKAVIYSEILKAPYINYM
jgi:hypothetical protein